MSIFTVEKIEDTNKSYIKFVGDKKKFSQYQKAIYAVSDKDRTWDSNKKQWCFTDEGILKLKVLLGDNDSNIIFDKQLNSSSVSSLHMTKEQVNSMGDCMKLKPFEYQKEVLSYMVENPQMLLVLPCGAGK